MKQRKRTRPAQPRLRVLDATTAAQIRGGEDVVTYEVDADGKMIIRKVPG